MKCNFNQQLKTAFTKLLFIFTLITFVSSIQAQRTFTICKGDEVFLSGFTQPPLPPQPPRGAPSTPPTYCYYGLNRTILPTDGLVERGGGGYTVAPTVTTTYSVTSISVPGIPPPDGFPPSDNCRSGSPVLDLFIVIVEDCSVPACNSSDPFAELLWLNERLDLADENGYDYSDYIQLHEVEGENYIELFPELNNHLSEIYTCNGILFCERKDSLTCNQFNESTLADTYYNTTCTASADEANAGDNKIDLEAIEINPAYYVSYEGYSKFRFNYTNNGPCYLYEADFIVEVNGEIIGTQNWTGSVRQDRNVSVSTDFDYYFEPDTEYDINIWAANPNGNRDLNLSNDTIKIFFEGFESEYNFLFDKFTSPAPIFMDGMQTVSINFENFSNARVNDLIQFNWSVNGEIQTPFVSEDLYYETRKGEVILGAYYFEKGKDYKIDAWIELPELPEEEQIQDKLFYLMPASDVKTDLCIVDVKYLETAKAFQIQIENKGNISTETLDINWSVNGIQQPTFQASDLIWTSYSNVFILNEYVYFNIETAAINENVLYTLDFKIDLPPKYTDVNQQNNSYAFTLYNQLNEEVDRIYTVCEGDSITLKVGEFAYWPNPIGLSAGCTKCTVAFDNPTWMFNNEFIDTTTTITIKPVNEGIYTFSTKAHQICREICGSPPGSPPTGAPSSSTSGYIQDDVKIKIIVNECEKKEPDCANNFGNIFRNSNRISSSGKSFLAFNEQGERIEFSNGYLRFDYELLGPVITPDSNHNRYTGQAVQPITITCFEEIYEEFPRVISRFEEICIGDQFQETLKLPKGLGVEYENFICDILKSEFIGTPSIESSVSNDCIFNFEVVNNFSEFSPFLEANYENINYSTQVQTINRKEPVSLQWLFSFLFEENCEPTPNPIFNNYTWLTNFANPTACNGESVYVYDADTYEFLIVKTNLGESMYKTNGELICFSPAGGFSFIGLYNESRILDSWHCEEGFEGRESKPAIQNQSIQIFPNPAKDKVFIKLQQLTFEQPVISIYDVQGKQVKQLASAEAFAGIVQLNVGDLERGIYLVEVRTNENILTKKLLIQ